MDPNDTNAVFTRGRYTIDSIDNAARILLMLNDRSWLRIADIARELDVARSTAHRMVSTLLARGLLRYNPDDKSYGAGFRLVELGMAIIGVGDLKGEAAPFLARVAAETGETCQLVVLEGSDIIFLSAVEGGHVIRAASRVGARVAAHATAGGKCILAWMNPKDVELAYPLARLAQVTPATVDSRQKLFAILAEVRQTGFAVNDGESEEGLAAVSSPIVDAQGSAHGAISLSGPQDRVRINFELYRDSVQRAARDVGRKLFGAPPA